MNKFPSISNNPTIALIYLTYNRFYYTKETLPALLNSSKYPFKVRIVDNGSTDETVEFLKELSHPNIETIIFNKKNEGLVKPTKKFWKETDAELVGKIDNDILVPKGWISTLIEAHKKIPELGVAGFCHFRKEDFNNDIVRNKVLEKNGTYLRGQPWIGGNYLMKSIHINKFFKRYSRSWKFLSNRSFHGFTKFQRILTENGLLNGYVCDQEKNLLFWEHIDDPRNSCFQIKSDYKNRIMDEDIIEWYKRDATNLLEKY